MNALGSALQSGNIANAQQAYSSLQQDLVQFSQTSSTPFSASAASGAVSITA